jgi:hypothetical protein
MAELQYDVSISFLSADEPIAAALCSRLSEGLEVFFYPRKQEDLAGSDGMESMRTPFFEGSRVVVVLYREPWGKTPWTRVEETAIKDGCLEHGWRGLFFIMLDASEPPTWLPHTHVRYNYAAFGFEGAVGAIKARVVDSGGRITPLTTPKRAELARQETDYLEEKQRLRSPSGHDIVRQMAAELFPLIKSLCHEIDARGSISIQTAFGPQSCHLRNRASLTVNLALTNHPDHETVLVVREFYNRLWMPGEQRLFYPDGEPQELREARFVPDINRAREWGWSPEAEPDTFLSSAGLADRIVSKFIDLDASLERARDRL